MRYSDLIKMNGEKCYTLTRDFEATMYVDQDGIEVEYPSGYTVSIPRDMIEKAIQELKLNGELTVNDVHERITHGYRTRTDKLMAVLRKLPGVTIDKRPRALYYKS